MGKHKHSHSEHAESAKQDRNKRFAEDLVYTINHAIVCGTTDVIDPFIGNWTQKKIGSRWRLTIFPHGHDHGHDHHHGHDHEHGGFWEGMHHWVVGEAIGDLGAVPLTLAMQHYTPWAMKGIQAAAEPALGPLFKWSTERYAKDWAYEQGLPADAPEVQERAQELYQHEVDHLPHAFVWTGAAAALNVLSQKYITRSKASVDSMVLGKLGGSAGTLITVLGFRSLFPKNVEKLDEWNTRNIAEPATRWVSRKLGIGEDIVDRVLEEEQEMRDGHRLHKKHHHQEKDAQRLPDTKVHADQTHVTSPVQFNQLIG